MWGHNNTYCNPLSIPDYPYCGKELPFAEQFLPVTGEWKETNEAIFFAPVRPYRSFADPDVVFHDGKWYMYGTCNCAYVSSDMYRWQRHNLIPQKFDAAGQLKEGRELTNHEKMLYENWIAPAVTYFKDRFLLVRSSTNAIYSSTSPFGPFEKCGTLTKPNGEALWCDDPAFLVDGDRIFLYFGCGVQSGIQGVELDAQDPTKCLTDPVRIIEFDSQTIWQCTGARYQESDCGWIEGANALKHNGRYYLTFAANGTRYDTYNTGVYYSDESPLSGFHIQKNGPFCEKRLGICKGAGHGSIVKGPSDSIWFFYTSVAASTHMYERRVGMDKVIVNREGFLEVITTDDPQWVPGITDADTIDNAAGIRALTYQNPAWATSALKGREPFYTTDESMATWWEPDVGDNKRQLVVSLMSDYTVSASRVLWKEYGFDEDRGIVSGPICYKVEVTENIDSGKWVTVLDMSQNSEDYLNDYRTFAPARGNTARLTILNTPKDVSIGVISFSVYGKK